MKTTCKNLSAWVTICYLALPIGCSNRMGSGRLNSGMNNERDEKADVEVAQPDWNEPTDDGPPDHDHTHCGSGKHDTSTQLCWQHPMAEKTYSWSDAVDYCRNLNLDGHSDWYLPDAEFIEILDGCIIDHEIGLPKCNSCGESRKCKTLFGSDTRKYWASYTEESGVVVDFGSGSVEKAAASEKHRVRCVRRRLEKVDCKKVGERLFGECFEELMLATGQVTLEQMEIFRKSDRFVEAQKAAYNQFVDECSRMGEKSTDGAAINSCMRMKTCETFAICITSALNEDN